MRTVSVVVAVVCGVMLQTAPTFSGATTARAAAVPTGAVYGAPSGRAAVPAAPAGSAVRKLSLGVSMIRYSDLDVLDRFTNAMGGRARRPAIWSVWSDWLGPNAQFPTHLMDELDSRGILPMVLWEPADPRRQNAPVITYKKIIDGDFDAYIHRWAAAAAAYGRPIILRFAHEMDGSWFPWSIGKFGNTRTTFINAWRHIWSIFKGPYGEGALNVRFLWSPFSPGDWMTDHDRGIYPGDRYVDYLGFTGFNWADSTHPWTSMQQVFQGPVSALRLIAKHKPIIAAETGTISKPDAAGRSKKPGWIASGYRAAYNAYPDIVAIVYFNVEMSGQRNWRLDVPKQAIDAYASLLSDARFQGRLTWSVPAPPDVGKPVVSLATGVKAKNRKARVTWRTTSSEPIWRYHVDSNSGSGWTPVHLRSPAKASAIAPVSESWRTRFRIRAQDVYGRSSAWAVTEPVSSDAVQETDPAVILTGKFVESHSSDAFGKSLAWTGARGQTATFAFTGRAVGFVSSFGPDRGRARLYLDGAKIGKIDLYNRRVKSGQVVFAVATSPGAHTLRVKVVGDGRGSGRRVDVDGFLVLR